MRERQIKRVILGSVLLLVVIPGGLVYRRYQQDMSLGYQRVSSGGKIIHTACGPIQYTDFGKGSPMLIVHGTGGGYDRGESAAQTIPRAQLIPMAMGGHLAMTMNMNTGAKQRLGDFWLSITIGRRGGIPCGS